MIGEHSMNDTLRQRLVLHAAAVILLGMLSGIPLAMTMLDYLAGNVDDWKVSHMEGLINGLLMLAIAGAANLLSLTSMQQRGLYLSIICTGYSNALYGWVRGFSGQLGMDFAPPLTNQLAALLGGVPIVTAFIAIALLMLGAYKSYR
jgi:hypothetical protein